MDEANPPDIRAVERACARLFASADGALLMAHLRRQLFHITLGPEVGEARLRHLEGQRALVLSLAALTRRGTAAPHTSHQEQ